MATLLERYLRGEGVEVWDEIYELDADGHRRGEIEEVCTETMKRVLRNIERIVKALDDEGFLFNNPDNVFLPPPPDVDDLLAELDAKIARVSVDQFTGKPLPPSVRAWYRIVGSVDLSGYSQRWPDPVPIEPQYDFDYFLGDGLVVHPLEYLLEAAEEIPPGTANLTFSPDIFHKEDISGGPPYAFYVTSPSADAFCTEIQTAFVPYLRWSLDWVGYPGLRLYQNAPAAWIDHLKAQLEPF